MHMRAALSLPTQSYYSALSSRHAHHDSLDRSIVSRDTGIWHHLHEACEHGDGRGRHEEHQHEEHAGVWTCAGGVDVGVDIHTRADMYHDDMYMCMLLHV